MKSAILKTAEERWAANEAARESFAVNIGPVLSVDGAQVANEASGKGVWVQLSPFGRFPNKFDGRVEFQVMTPQDGDAMVTDFKSVANSVKRIKGLPWYVGHPDHPDFADKYSDTGAKGRIKDLQCRHDSDCADCAQFANEEKTTPCTAHGLFALAKFNDDGKALIANEAFDGHSVNWRLQRRADGWHPVHLKSVGFTNEANIPVPPVMAANENPMANQPTFIDRVRSLLKLKDSANEDDAYGAMESMCNEHNTTTQKHKQLTDQLGDIAKRFGANEVVDPTLASLKADTGLEVPAEGAVVFLANEVKTRCATLKTKDSELTIANEKATKATERVTAMETEMANQRKADVTALGEVLIVGGFITKAEHEALIKDKDFGDKATCESFMANAKTMKPKINTRSGVALGGQGADVNKQVNLQGELTTMANEIQSNKTKAGKRTNWDSCWAEACNSTRGKEILLLMKKPEVQVEPAKRK